ncbi:hypothetical protein KC19_12G030900 [Ceratodon purpureus]|uniref:Uncharacterized protein n=1 Tax=Ceratodon purpureus TaxID=3225 RepID=A0A8T0G3L8_CERPU|nr:hypothetical protein KC19_12G030900 [Ceratodon purpureus]
MGWSRQIWVFFVALTVFFEYKLVRKREKWAKSSSVKSKLWEKAHERNAKRVYNAIVGLEGLWVKAGQYLSTRADVLPDPYIEVLRQLQDSLPPRPLKEVNATIKKELGKDPSELFLHFDTSALATASIAQVHRARTKDGKDVVVKVQHKGIKDIILQDLKNARTIVQWVAWAEPDYNFGPVMDEWCNEVPKELNFKLEAENTLKVAKNLDYNNKEVSAELSKNHVDVLVPEILQSTEKVLIMVYMDGVRLNDVAKLKELGVDVQALVESITRSYAHQIYVDGFFNADPHPGNFLVSKEPPFRPILLDFGLTKTLTFTKKQALAKMLLACAEGDYAALLSAFAEIGLKLRMDMPEDAMQVTNFFFRRSIPGKESPEDIKQWTMENEERKKRFQEKQEEEKGSSLHRNPVDAFPGDIVFFMRVLNLLRGLSSMLGARVVYIEIMRPFAETALFSGNVFKTGCGLETESWIHKTPSQSSVESKLRVLLQNLGREDHILGVQVCVYKDGNVIVDTAAGVLGKFDPRPVQPDSLFSCFSVTKGITAGLLHWLADQGKLSLSERVSTYWPEFAVNGKEDITVAHVLNHTAGLQNALASDLKSDPLLMCNWDETLKKLAAALPESSPGVQQVYHALTFGWLCGGIIEKVSGKKFQDLLEEVFVRPLGLNGEFYVGIPAGIEDRLASLTLDTEEVKTMKEAIEKQKAAVSLKSLTTPIERFAEPSETIIKEATSKDAFGGGDAMSTITALPVMFNTLFVRRAIIPAANGHFSARALARYYATLATGGLVPPISSLSEPPLGSHPHKPFDRKFDPLPKGRKKDETKKSDRNVKVVSDIESPKAVESVSSARIFSNPRIHDAFLAAGEYSNLAYTAEKFGLGFRRITSGESKSGEEVIGFGHSGVGGSTGFCYPTQNFVIAITLNKLSQGGVTAQIVRLVTREMGLPCPAMYKSVKADRGPDTIGGAVLED